MELCWVHQTLITCSCCFYPRLLTWTAHMQFAKLLARDSNARSQSWDEDASITSKRSFVACEPLFFGEEGSGNTFALTDAYMRGAGGAIAWLQNDETARYTTVKCMAGRQSGHYLYFDGDTFKDEEGEYSPETEKVVFYRQKLKTHGQNTYARATRLRSQLDIGTEPEPAQCGDARPSGCGQNHASQPPLRITSDAIMSFIREVDDVMQRWGADGVLLALDWNREHGVDVKVRLLAMPKWLSCIPTSASCMLSNKAHMFLNCEPCHHVCECAFA